MILNRAALAGSKAEPASSLVEPGWAGKVAVNMRAAAFETGGQQRMTLELVKRLVWLEKIAPDRALRGIPGHAWEQFVLPSRARGKLLWSPSATGAVSYAKQIVTLHDLAFFDVPECFAPSFVTAYQALIPRLVRRVAHVVTVSAFSRERIIERLGLAPERVSVIHNGVSAAFAPSTAEEIAAMRSKIALHGRYVLVQATSDPRKNLTGTLQAWRLAHPKIDPEVELVVFGLTGRTHVFGRHHEMAALPRMRQLGFVPDDLMPALMSGAEIFMFPSLYEGFGLPVIEAMRAGTPVLTSATTALAEVAGEAALCVDPASPEAIAEGVLALLNDAQYRASLAIRGKQHATKFDWDIAAKHYSKLFDQFS